MTLTVTVTGETLADVKRQLDELASTPPPAPGAVDPVAVDVTPPPPPPPAAWTPPPPPPPAAWTPPPS